MIVRTYHCLDCGDLFEVDCYANDPDPPCPYCAKVLQWRPGMFSISTDKSRAVNLTQEILENDYGLTNFKEAPREGDVSGMGLPPATGDQRATIDELERQCQQEAEAAKAVSGPVQAAVNQFWGDSPGLPAGLTSAVLAGTKVGPGAHIDPMKIFHDGGRLGKLPSKFRVIGQG